jgi:hypothetical protein
MPASSLRDPRGMRSKVRKRICRPYGTRDSSLWRLLSPALPCRVTGCVVPTGLGTFGVNGGPALACRARDCGGSAGVNKS